MTCLNPIRSPLRAVLALLVCTVVLSAQNTKPIALKGLVDALNLHGMSNAEIAQIIKTRGVDFELNADAESQLKAAGADADLLAVVRANYCRPGAPCPLTQPAAPQPPSASFGAAQSKAPEAAPTSTDAQPTATDTKAPAPVAGHPVASLKDVKNLYIEPMVNDLDQYLKAEFSKQLAGRVMIVLKADDANAVMTGTGEWHKGTGQAITGRMLGLHDTATGAVTVTSKDNVLWASEAGDRSIWWGVLKRGGQRKVADRIVHNFKRALEQK